MNPSERALVVAPIGRDASTATEILRSNGVEAASFPTVRAACEAATAGGVGVMIVAEEALTSPQLDALSALLEAAPAWSDLPLIVFGTGRIEEAPVAPRILQRFNVTILERPVAVRTLLAAVQVALRARRRQYEVSALLVRAESASRAKDDFLAMLGHELRNPLSPIVTALHIMGQREPGENEHELTVLQRQVAHLSRLVDDLLDVSRIAQGKVDVRRDVLALRDVIARAVEMASPLIEQRRHVLEVTVEGEPRVAGDATRLAQVFANLLVNAAKYTMVGGHVALTAARSGDSVVVRVRDDGVGITPEMLPQVFELFAQERQTSARSGGGLGLGLAIARNLVKLHGGTITAASAGLNQGSEFTVTLPMVDAAVSLTLRTPVSVAPVAQGRILVVDDNEDAAEMLAFALSTSGYATRVAHDGPGALRVAQEFRPDVAVLDIGLPVMDGYQLAGRLRHVPTLEHLPMIALTGYSQEEDVRRAREAGFEEHFAKPVDIDRLQSAVTRILKVG